MPRYKVMFKPSHGLIIFLQRFIFTWSVNIRVHFFVYCCYAVCSFALRGLTYFDDAEDDPMPEMLIPITWSDVKRKIESVVREFVKTV